MPLKLDSSVITFLLVVLILFTFALSMKTGKFRVVKIIFQLLAGGIFLLIFNFVGNIANISIPLNPVTAFFAGIFQIPGIALLLIVKYIIYA